MKRSKKAQLRRECFMKKSCSSFGFCPNYVPQRMTYKDPEIQKIPCYISTRSPSPPDLFQSARHVSQILDVISQVLLHQIQKKDMTKRVSDKPVFIFFEHPKSHSHSP